MCIQWLQRTGHPSRDRRLPQYIECLCRRTVVAGPQLSSTVRCRRHNRGDALDTFDLASLHGAVLYEIAISENELRLLFRPDGALGIRGDWELRDGAGNIVDRSVPNAERDALRLHMLLGSEVAGSEAPAPQSFNLRFKNGLTLCATDYSTAYRTFSVHPDLEPRGGGI